MTTIIADEHLILRLKAGDLGALGELYDLYNADLYRTTLGITYNQSEAGKILQECFLALNRKVHDLDKSLSIKTWLYREMANLIYARAKHRIRWPISPDSNNSFAQNNSIRSKHFKLATVIATLEIHQRIVVVLYYYNSLKIAEIAEILECSQGTVKSRLHYGRESLRRQLVHTNIISPELKGGHTFNIEEIFFHNKEI
ncbi:MAG: RNA polymerase sigma factor [Anaerolineales bacterium]|nr:RNA polymerase sigma factor [Chloroflexota bacterium]MBL6979964.1 RNA polymerase sigma factor [Anaerolineales bacterium]